MHVCGQRCDFVGQRNFNDKPGPKHAQKVLKVAGEVVISEKIREHLTATVMALVDEMQQGIRNAVAEDPRIQKRFIRIEKAVRDYKRKLAQKRKDKLNMFRAASEMALSGLLNRAYALIHSALCKAELNNVLFTERDPGQRAARRR